MGGSKGAHSRIGAAVAIVVASSCWEGRAEHAPPGSGAFTSVGDMDVARFGHSATRLPDGTVLVVGGDWLADGTTAERFDPATERFTLVGTLADIRLARHSATLLRDGTVLIAGGATIGSASLASAERFNPITGLFSVTGQMAARRSNHSATLLRDGTVLVAGGRDDESSTYLSTAELYDPETGTFTTVGDMLVRRGEHTATLLEDGSVLIVAGYNDADGPLASAERYDPSTRTFSATGGLAASRVEHTATLLADGRVLVAGGYGAPPTSDLLRSAERYDPAAGVFTRVGDLTTQRRGHGAVRLDSGVVLVAGGISGEQYVEIRPGRTTTFLVCEASAETYDPETGSFTSARPMSDGRTDFATEQLSDGSVLFSGGIHEQGWGVARGAERYRP